MVIRAPQTVINISYSPLPAFSSPPVNEDLPGGRAAAVVYFHPFNNRFFRHQGCYSLLPVAERRHSSWVIDRCKVLASKIIMKGERKKYST